MNCAQKNEIAMKTSQEPNIPSDRRKRSRLLDAEVGQSIRHHRKAAKMTLQGLADKLGIAYQQVQKYETGVNRVGAGRLMEIAEILNIPVSHFFGAAAASPSDATVTNETDAALLGRQLLVNFMKIKDPQKRQDAFSYVKSLADFDMA